MGKERNYELDLEMQELDYYHSEDVQSAAVDLALRYHSIEELAGLLHIYAYGLSFMYADAYRLCSIANYWPAFIKHPRHSEYVLDFEQVNSLTGKDDYHERFEKMFIETRDIWNTGEVHPVQRNFRLKVCMAAAKVLGIDWKDVKNSQP